MSNTFVDDLTYADYALLFGGQATPWRSTLNDLSTPELDALLQNVVKASDFVLEIIENEFITLHPRKVNFFGDSTDDKNDKFSDSEAFVSLPGILLAQTATLFNFLKTTSSRLKSPVSVQGHSQGILAREIVAAFEKTPFAISEELVSVFVLSRLIGAAAAKTCSELRISSSFNKEEGLVTPMLSVKGTNQKTLEKIIATLKEAGITSNEVVIAVKNTNEHFIVSGYPSDLAILVEEIEKTSAASKKELEKKLTGGSPLEVVTEFLDVTAPFHSPLLASASLQVQEWAAQVGLDPAFAKSYAEQILVDQVDWVADVQAAMIAGAKYLIDLGPGSVIYKMSQNIVVGSGVTLLSCGGASDIQKIVTPGFKPELTQNWEKFAPKVTKLANGQVAVSTAFTRLTGRSPIMLAGMTPTTVEPEIVAAAANAGYWAEVAGGGQVTANVFNENLEKLQELLNPGRTVAFNSMFLDRYLWNLQFGGQKIVSKARGSGAPIDGVIITAGIPEFDEAVELVKTLNAEGFPYVAFKPGTVKQIKDTIRIANAVSDYTVIIQVEDGHAGGHHSWDNLDDLLLATYSDIRNTPNLVLCAGGGIGTPERGADYISGDWALEYGKVKMPVDGVLVGTAAMTAKEAKTTPDVKKLLLNTPGISKDDQGGWVGATKSKGGMTSSLSHLRADIYEIDNDSAAAARLILEVNDDLSILETRRDEIIAALGKTAKPYFGDIEEMSYFEMLNRFANLCFIEENISLKNAEESWVDRFLDLLRRSEARNSNKQSGKITSIFNSVDDVVDYKSALEKISSQYPDVLSNEVSPIDAAYFIEVCRKHPKPCPFVPILNGELFKWWGGDSLWQSHDKRYPASSCRIIPGPVSVAGIDRIDEPIASLLGRFETAAIERLTAVNPNTVNSFARIGEYDPNLEGDDKKVGKEVTDIIAYIQSCLHISWTGHLINNPANFLKDDQYELKKISDNSYDLIIKLDTFWDNIQNPEQFHVVRELVIPIDVTADSYNGGVLVVNEERLPDSMFSMLATTAGKGSTMASGDFVEGLPLMQTVADNTIGGVQFSAPEFGRTKFTFHSPTSLGVEHKLVTGNALDDQYICSNYVPDALLGTCWPPIYAALGSATINLNGKPDYPVIEGLLNAVHLDHTVDLVAKLEDIENKKLNAYAWAESIQESQSGRVVDVRVVVTVAGPDGADSNNEPIAIRFRERFAIQGRAYGNAIPESPEEAGGKLVTGKTLPTKRRLLRIAKVKAPEDMTPFARISGDYNPIHTSTNAARVAGLEGPIVHGMWLSAVAQHLIQADTVNSNGFRISGWTVQWYSPTQLNDEVELTLERIGKIEGGGLILEVVAKIGGVLTAKFTASTEPERIAYCYPGQGIQQQGMALDEMQVSPAAKEVWERADRHTRKALGFSILSIVKNNPTTVVVKGKKLYHPEGLLNLTQFTQVSLAVVGFAQTARLKESGSYIEGGFFAGHSLGEYVALSAYGNVMSLETIIELVFARGSAMHSLVPRDENGRSDYLMGALRPNQFGITDATVKDYVKSIADSTGEFLEIVNFNLSGQQYAVSGTIAGLKALKKDAEKRVEEFGGRGAFMYVPGIDVPFHSSVLRSGVPEFRDRLMKLLPAQIDYNSLVGRYIPNLVARPFEFSIEFATSILEVVPSEQIIDVVENWKNHIQDLDRLGRILLVELLCWQFASPVRWIETQTLLFSKSGLDVEHFVEVGLKNSPTLANLASKTLQLDEFISQNITVHNIQRDEARVYYEDDDAAVMIDDDDEDEVIEETTVAPAPAAAVISDTPAPAAAPAAVAVSSTSGGSADDVPFKASDAINMLFAFSNKLGLEQIGANDTAETLTNGVSSRRNQLLMDMSAELGLASIDSAAEAPVSALCKTVDKMAPGYKPFGPVLGEISRSAIRKLFGSAGVKQGKIAERVTSVWGLGSGWVDFVTAEIVLGTREGQSIRGGDLTTLAPATPASAKDVEALIDTAVTSIATKRGVAVSLQGAGGGAGGGVVDSEALDAFAATVTGDKGVLASTARQILKQLGLDEPVELDDDDTAAQNAAVVDAVEAELGSDWFKRTEPVFNANKAIQLDDRWASAKEDLATLFVNGEFADGITPNFTGTGKNIADQALYYSKQCVANGNSNLATKFDEVARLALVDGSNSDYVNDVAVVTGAAPTSIAGAVAGKLLEGGATVIMTASSINSKRLDFAKKLYRQHASADAQLWIVPANLSSYRDVDALIDWIGNDVKETVGGKTKILKPAFVPTLLFPFAAPSVHGTLADAGSEAEMETRLLLWSVERMIAKLSTIGVEEDIDRRLHVVLPGSPNRGIFGGDGAYGEVKAAFDAIEKRWSVEKRWSKNVTLAHPKIGWVRGTSLMGGNDLMAPLVEAKGVKTYSTPEIADELLTLCTPDARQKALNGVIDADLTGGLGDGINLVELKGEAVAKMKLDAELDAVKAADAQSIAGAPKPTSEIQALPNPVNVSLPDFRTNDWKNVTAKPEDIRVIVGIGEVGPWGSGRTRFEAEHGIQTDGTVDLTPAGVLELAWMMDLVHWAENPTAGWYDSDDNLIAEEDIFEKYRDEVVARSGVRAYIDDDLASIKDLSTEQDVAVFLDRDITFSVPNRELAQSYKAIDPEKTIILEDPENDEWTVTKLQGAKARVPRKTAMTRRAGGQLPTNFDPAKWGIPANMIESVDRLAIWNLVSTVDAFLSSGFSPAELLKAVHPSDVGSTQGTGIGGTDSMRKLFVDGFNGEDRPSDILQEALPNVIAAHVMQSYVGGYGVMVHPVGACATAAVSIEDAVDKIDCGKADFVVAGAIDDLSIESISGFGDMNATAKTQDLLDKGINERFVSRANDRRRGGFVESEGGGTVLITRGDIALKLGLPVFGIVGYARSFADGAHTSIPAPGIGALGAARGGTDSVLVKKLAALGVTADDVKVVSKHDTSTNANDPNESELYVRLFEAIGRTPGNPLYVISQKTVTGHAKGGAAIFQVSGLCQLFKSGKIPANRALDCVGDEFKTHNPITWIREPLNYGNAGSIKAAMVTSLGFGHVAGLITLVHPGAFEAAVAKSSGEATASQWRERANERLKAGRKHLELGQLGRLPLFEPIDHRRFEENHRGYDSHEVEAAILLNPNARLGDSDTYLA
jgi:fatty acid synthase